MNKLTPKRPGQEIWEHEGETYSIVDLTSWPELMPSDENVVNNYVRLMKETYGAFPIEIARVTGDRVEVLDRFSTFEEAREAIEDGLGF